ANRVPGLCRQGLRALVPGAAGLEASAGELAKDVIPHIEATLSETGLEAPKPVGSNGSHLPSRADRARPASVNHPPAVAPGRVRRRLRAAFPGQVAVRHAGAPGAGGLTGAGAATGRRAAVSQSPNAHEPACGGTPMNFELLIPIAFFAAVAYVIKVVVDAGVRRRMVEANGSQELVRSILLGEEQRSRLGSLRWGVILIALAVGFGIVDAGNWDEL